MPELEEDAESAQMDRKREELSRKIPDIGSMIAETPGIEEDLERTQIGTVFGSGS